jgi:hypothetical protein
MIRKPRYFAKLKNPEGATSIVLEMKKKQSFRQPVTDPQRSSNTQAKSEKALG